MLFSENGSGKGDDMGPLIFKMFILLLVQHVRLHVEHMHQNGSKQLMHAVPDATLSGLSFSPSEKVNR